MDMQGLGFLNVTEPAGVSKNICSAASKNSSEESISFDTILAGFFVSDDKNSDHGNLDGMISSEAVQDSDKSVEKDAILGKIFSLFYTGGFFSETSIKELNFSEISEGSDMQISENASDSNEVIYSEMIPEQTDEIIDNENISGWILENLLSSTTEVNEKIAQDYPDFKEKIVNMFQDLQVISKNLLEEFFQKDNINKLSEEQKNSFLVLLKNQLKDLKYPEEVLNKNILEDLESFIQRETEKSKAAVIANNGSILNEEQDNFKNLGQEIKAINLNSKLREDSSLRMTMMNEAKMDHKIENNGSGEKQNQSDSVQDKQTFILPKNAEDIQKIGLDTLSEKAVEPKNLPKYIENQIVNSLKTSESGTKEITVKISPEHLGKLTLKIVSLENQDISIKITAENKNIKDFIDNNLHTLRNNLEISGIRANIFNVEVDLEKNFNQFNGSNQSFSGESGRRKKDPENNEKESYENRIDNIFDDLGALEVFA